MHQIEAVRNRAYCRDWSPQPLARHDRIVDRAGCCARAESTFVPDLRGRPVHGMDRAQAP